MHEKDKSLGRKKRPTLDGIISDGRRLGLPVQGKQNKSEIDGLQRASKLKDGFHPMRSSNHAIGEPAIESVPETDLDQPIVLEDMPAKAKKLNLLKLSFRKKKSKSKGIKVPSRKLTLKKALLISGVFILLGGGFFGYKAYQAEKNLFRGGGKAPALSSKVDIKQLKGEGDGRINILLLGVGGPGHDGQDLTDTILICSIDPVNNKVDLLSIPRDLWVAIPGNGSQKINAAYAYGKQQSLAKTDAAKDQAGLDLLDKTIAPVIGVNIHYHAVFDFKAFKDLVDAVGGVTFDVPETLYDPTIAWENGWNSTIASKGTVTMHGQQALLYARSRETSSDFARGERQRLLIVALKEKILSLGTFSNPVKVSNMLSSLGSDVYTDFSLTDMNRLYQIVSKIPSTSINSLDLVTPPHNLLTTAPVNGLSTVQPRAGTYDYSLVQAYIKQTLKDGYIAKENATIAVYNATTTAGLATTKSTVLKNYGYNVTTVDSAKNATNPAKTVIVDLSGGKQKYTKNYLEKRFAATTVSAVPTEFGITAPVGTDFVIILGQDAATSSQN